MTYKISARADRAIIGVIGKSEFTPDDVSKIEYMDLFRQPNCGRKTISLIEKWMAVGGFAFTGYGRGLTHVILHQREFMEHVDANLRQWRAQ